MLVSDQCPYCEKLKGEIQKAPQFTAGLKQKYQVVKLEISSEEGRTIANKFQVRKVPAFITYEEVASSSQVFTGFSTLDKLANLLGIIYHRDGGQATKPLNPSASCGDGIVGAGEACDDGNTNPGDGCSATCTVETGFQCFGEPSVCQTTCGDGILAPAYEQCDDNDTTPGDGCSGNCTIEAGYSCTGSPSICTPICGDGLLTADESCDDGNTNSGDGCSSTCNIESGYNCIGVPSVCVTTCGDGLVAGMEACDDGNMMNGDGCNNSCMIEPGFQCTGQPSTCQLIPVCGNGVIESGEACDDGNIANGDGCSSSCSIDPGWVCTGTPSVCIVTCGNGVLDAGEECDDGNMVNGDGCNSACMFEGVSQGVSINRENIRAHPSSMLDVNSSDKGILIPRLTTAQRTAIIHPAKGLLVFDVTTGSFWFFNGTIWKQLASL